MISSNRILMQLKISSWLVIHRSLEIDAVESIIIKNGWLVFGIISYNSPPTPKLVTMPQIQIFHTCTHIKCSVVLGMLRIMTDEQSSHIRIPQIRSHTAFIDVHEE
jgi:hypothetical protein